jgi:hypothetical protein
MKFKVYELGTDKDVTDKGEWFIDIDGNLMFMTDDIDCPLHEASMTNYYYKLEIEVL